MNLLDIARPGVMISQVAPKSRETAGATVAILEQVVSHGWFAAVQTVEVNTPAERRDIAALVQDRGLRYTYCLARVQNEKKLNLSELDETLRQANTETIIRELETAVEAGADTVQLISGLRPGDPDRRDDALKSLQRSLAEISSGATGLSPLRIVIEPLDYFAHKRNTLGASNEAAALCKQLKDEGLDLFLCLDTAHMLLNAENLEDSLRICLPYAVEYHFCNCVTSPGAPLYGDHHIPFGPPGVMDVSAASRLLNSALSDGFLNTDRKPTLCCEVLNTQGRSPAVMIQEQHAFLEQAWQESNRPQPDAEYEQVRHQRNPSTTHLADPEKL